MRREKERNGVYERVGTPALLDANSQQRNRVRGLTEQHHVPLNGSSVADCPARDPTLEVRLCDKDQVRVLWIRLADLQQVADVHVHACEARTWRHVWVFHTLA